MTERKIPKHTLKFIVKFAIRTDKMLIYLVLFTAVVVFRLAQTNGVIYSPKSLVIADTQQKEKDRNFLIFAFLCIVVLTALRSQSVGPDTSSYINHFRRIFSKSETKFDKRYFEEGFRFVGWACSKITHSLRFYFLVCALITNLPVAWLMHKYSKNKLQSVILYIAIGSFTFQLTGLRQSMALGFLCLSMYFTLKRKPILFLLMIIIAFSFHRSAILFLPVYILGIPQINKRSILFMALSFGALYAGGSLFDRMSIALNYEKYIGGAAVEDYGGWTHISIMAIAIILYFVVRDSEKKLDEKDENVDRFFLIVLFFALALYTLRYQVRVAERVSLYYRTANIILLPNVINRIKNPVLRFCVNTACGLLAVALFIHRVTGSSYIYTPFWS